MKEWIRKIPSKYIIAAVITIVAAAGLVTGAILWRNASQAVSSQKEDSMKHTDDLERLNKPSPGKGRTLISFVPTMGKEEQEFLEDHESFYRINQFRFTEFGKHFVYKFALPEGVSNQKLLLDIAGQFEISFSGDGKNWTVVDFEKNRLTAPQERTYKNREIRQYEIDQYIGNDRLFFIKVGDSFKDDGWGGILYKLELKADVM